MATYTQYTKDWTMSMVIPYLLKYYFGNQPTSNKDLSEAFWKLMGKDIVFEQETRWTSGRYGVPYQIHQKIERGILQQVPPPSKRAVKLLKHDEHPEYPYFYILGKNGEIFIQKFLLAYPKHIIEQEIATYLTSIVIHDDPKEIIYQQNIKQPAFLRNSGIVIHV